MVAATAFRESGDHGPPDPVLFLVMHAFSGLAGTAWMEFQKWDGAAHLCLLPCAHHGGVFTLVGRIHGQSIFLLFKVLGLMSFINFDTLHNDSLWNIVGKLMSSSADQDHDGIA